MYSLMLKINEFMNALKSLGNAHIPRPNQGIYIVTIQ